MQFVRVTGEHTGNTQGDDREMMNNTRKPSLEHLEDRNLMSTTSITWMPSITTFQYGTKLGPAELNATIQSTGQKNPPVANLVYLDQNGNSVGNGTILPVGNDTITAQYGPNATAVQTFTVTPVTTLASPSLTAVSPQATTIQTTVNGAPTLGVTTLLSGGNHETGVLTFTLKITPQNQSLPSYMVTPALVNVSGDGFYSASYTIPAGLAGTYTWAATYSGDASNNPTGPSNLGTVTVQTPSVYAIFNGAPITQYWYYPTAAINTAALLYHVDLAQPIGCFGTQPQSRHRQAGRRQQPITSNLGWANVRSDEAHNWCLARIWLTRDHADRYPEAGDRDH